ncbi:MAG TPA: ATP-binding cassette domain-containing protein [Bacteriovoracaceae bacterium]|nr:ATP-binding cassette domain-containing protein [Bacteriovoracaceae bacterium]
MNLKLGDKLLFKDFNFSFAGPGIVLIEGDNGAGKSSLLKVFSGFINPTEGIISFAGKRPGDISPAEFSFFTTTSLGLLNDLTGREHIEVVAKALNVHPDVVNAKILEFKKIELFKEILMKPVLDHSQGMRQFLRLFMHIFFEPRILFLDEPFLYLSPKIRQFLQDQIEKLSSGSMVFLTDQKFTWRPMMKNSKILLGER